jgi:hypothetical protein
MQNSEFRKHPAVYASAWTDQVHLSQAEKRFLEIVAQSRNRRREAVGVCPFSGGAAERPGLRSHAERGTEENSLYIASVHHNA